MNIIFSLFMAMFMLSDTAGAWAEAQTLPPETELVSVLDQQELDQRIDTVIRNDGLEHTDVSVAYCYTGTGECYYYNADEWYYSASLYKLPMIMSLVRMKEEGELTVDFNEDFDYIIHRCLVYSDNSWSLAIHRLVFTPQSELRGLDAQLAGFPEEELPDGYYNNNIYSARFMLGVVQELYENAEDYPRVIDHLLEAQPDEYFRGELGDRYPIAQKYGSAHPVVHTAGIVYTPTPFLLVVMTSYAGIIPGEQLIGRLAETIADYTLLLDERCEQAEEESRLAREEQLFERERRWVDAAVSAAVMQALSFA